MQIASGLFDNMVLQRNCNNVSDALIVGTSKQSGKIIARVTKSGKAFRGFAGKIVGTAARGKFSLRLKGLPVGGPYTIKLSVNSEVVVCKNVCVGELWLLAGQSNMEGLGHLKHACKPVDMVRAFYMDDSWRVAEDPVHNLAEAVDPVHKILCGGKPLRDKHVGVGPGVAFAQEMFKRTGVPQGVIACAHGGSSMEQWDPAKKKLGNKSLYGAMLRRLRKNGGKVAGVLWYQGCSESNVEAASKYTKKMKKLVQSIRRDLKNTSLPFVAVQISRCFGFVDIDYKSWNSVQEQQRLLPEQVKKCLIVPAIDFELDDCIHISGYEHRRLGVRMAEAMAILTGNRQKGDLMPLKLKNYKLRLNRETTQVELLVTFSNVNKELMASGRPNGFYFHAGTLDNQIFCLELKGNTAVLKLTVDMATAKKSVFGYGFGCNPYCNITDAADRSLPVFGPISIKR